MIHRFILASVVIVIASTSGTAVSESDRGPGKIKVGVLFELSGPGAALARDAQMGLEAGQDAYVAKSGPGIQLIYGDTHDDAMTGLSEFRRMVVTEGVSAVYVIRSKIAMPLNPLSKQSGTVLIGGVGHPDFVEQNPFALRVFPSASREGEFLARAAVQMGRRRLAMLTLEDEWTLALSSEFAREFAKLGGKVVYRQSAGTQETDFSTTISRLRASRPDAVFINLLLAQTGPVAKKLREQGVTGQFFSNYWVQKPEVLQAAGDALEGTVFAEADVDRPLFRQIFMKKFPGVKIIPAHYLAFAAYAAIAGAISGLPANYSRDQITEALLNQKSIILPDESMEFNNREARIDLRLRAISHGASAN